MSMLPPSTRFSGTVSSHRVFEAVGLPLADFKMIRDQVGDVTVNDLFLAIVGGALRTYLSSKNELPDASMIAMVPLTLRGADKGGDRGNQVGFTAMSVHTEIADPIERLREIHAGAQTSKEISDALGKELARDLLEHLPNVVTHNLLRNVKLPGVGLIVSNVRGPDVPLYMAGARLVNYVPISIAVDSMGLNVTGFSYAGVMRICAISCREMLPDPAYFADCLSQAFADLKRAAADLGGDQASPRPAQRGPAGPQAAGRQVQSQDPARHAQTEGQPGVNGRRGTEARHGSHRGRDAGAPAGRARGRASVTASTTWRSSSIPGSPGCTARSPPRRAATASICAVRPRTSSPTRR